MHVLHLEWEASQNFNSTEKWSKNFNSTQQNIPAAFWPVWSTYSAQLSLLNVLQLWMKSGYSGAGKKARLQVKGTQLLALSSIKLILYHIWGNFKRRHFRKGKGNAFNKNSRKLEEFQACLAEYLWTCIYNEWFRLKLKGVSHNWK